MEASSPLKDGLKIVDSIEELSEKLLVFWSRMENRPRTRGKEIMLEVFLVNEKGEIQGVAFYRQHICDLGVFVVKEYRRKGYGYFLLEYLIKKLDLPYLEAHIDSANIASIKLFSKCGFVFNRKGKTAEDADVYSRGKKK